MYNRVIPRDLFNEAKLLKCMGRLCMLIHDGLTPFVGFIKYEGDAFNIRLHDDGHLEITNLYIKVNKIWPTFKTIYNSKSNYPLLVDWANGEFRVFDGSGEFDEEFLQFIKEIQ